MDKSLGAPGEISELLLPEAERLPSEPDCPTELHGPGCTIVQVD